MVLFLFGMIAAANASTYILNQTQIHVSDRMIQFGDYLDKKMQEKGHTPVQDGEVPEYVVDLSFTTYKSRNFEHAKSVVNLVNVNTGQLELAKEADVRCYTQVCTAGTASKAIRQSIDLFGKAL